MKKLFIRNNLPKKEHALKRGIYSTVFIIAVVVIVALVNIFATLLYEKYPLEIDLTQNKVYSLSEENIEYIKSVKDDVTVYVWAKKSDFTDGTLQSYFQSNFYIYDETGKYFTQMMKNIEAYSKYNDKIKIEYVDTNSPEAADIKSNFSNDYIYGGDLLLMSTVKIDGKDITRTKHINSFDLFTTGTDNSSGYSKIMASNLENDLSAAINYVTSKKINKFAFMKGIGDVSVLSKFKEGLEINSFQTEEITNFKSLTDEFDGVVLATPTKDLTEKELDILDEFLDNGGKKGKVLLTFGNTSAAPAPNYAEFLSEWGLEFGSGTVMETSTDYHYPENPYIFFYSPESTDYGKQIPSDMYLVSADNAPINILFEQDGQRKTQVLAYSNDTAVIRPKNADKNWKPNENNTSQIPLVVASVETAVDESAQSTVLAFSSTNIAGEEWTESTTFANIDFMVGATKYAADKNSDAVTFSVSTITEARMLDQVTETSATIMQIIFVYLLPISCLVIGVVVFFKRKNR